MGETKAVFDFFLGSMHVQITQSIIVQWAVIVILAIAGILLSKNLKEVPKGKQVWAELIVEKLYGMVDENMGAKYQSFKPFIGAFFIYILALNLTGFLGFAPPTSSISTTMGLALVTFLLIQGTSIKKNGILHYFKAYTKPFAVLLPINIMDRLTVPVSLCLRLFGNMFAGTIIVELVYDALEGISHSVGLKIPIFDTFIPIPVHLYFDAFDGAIHALIFTMLTMIFIKTTSEE